MSRYQDSPILCGTFKSHTRYFPSIIAFPHPGRRALIPQSCNEFKKAFNRPACLDLHWGQLRKSRQLTPNQLPHGWWVSRMGHPQRTLEMGLNMKPHWPLLSSLLFHRLHANPLCKDKPLIASPSLSSSACLLAISRAVINGKWRTNKSLQKWNNH